MAGMRGIYLSNKPRQIIAIGGGAFSLQPDSSLLDRYILAQADAARPQICLIPTATGDSERYILNFYRAVARHDCIPSDLSLFTRTTDLRSVLLTQDVIFVGGGNTKSMLAVWREWGLVEVLREAYDQGIVLCGVSAGAICWFEQGITDSWTERLRSLKCLGFLKGSLSPHYDSEPQRKPAFHRMLLEGQIVDGIALDDGVAVHFVDEQAIEFVSYRAIANAFRLNYTNGKIEEATLSTRLLA